MSILQAKPPLLPVPPGELQYTLVAVTLTDRRSCRGIGAAIAIQLGKRGANVVVNYTSDKSKQRANDVVKSIEATGSKAVLCQASVARVDDISKIVDAARQLSETGKIEILVHKYGLHPYLCTFMTILTNFERTVPPSVSTQILTKSQKIYSKPISTPM